jgi:tetratricopeptide (TPR) repeat protein
MNANPARILTLTMGLIVTGLSAIAATSNSTLRPAEIPAILLVEPPEQTALDAQIRTSQARLKTSGQPGAELERLAWLWVAKARASSDPGYMTFAGLAAETLEKEFNLLPQAQLLRGHVLHSRHRFAEAEQLGRELVASRAAPADYALLGDALYDQGKTGEAAEAYQHMVDLKPSLDSYARAANIRWIKGDLAGAVELQTLAVRAGGRGDPGSLAWALVRLAQFTWQTGEASDAMTLASRALELVPDFQPALLLQGRLLLAADRPKKAIERLNRAVELLPLPEARWVLADALRATGRTTDAELQEDLLVQQGATEDPRTVAFFLATKGQDLPTAVRLAAAELSHRADVMTHSANSLALAMTGNVEQAMTHQRESLVEGTIDARLFLYAGRVAALAQAPGAKDLLEQASRLQPQLLPSERALLTDSLSLLQAGSRPSDNSIETTPHKTS